MNIPNIKWSNASDCETPEKLEAHLKRYFSDRMIDFDILFMIVMTARTFVDDIGNIELREVLEKLFPHRKEASFETLMRDEILSFLKNMKVDLRQTVCDIEILLKRLETAVVHLEAEEQTA